MFWSKIISESRSILQLPSVDNRNRRQAFVASGVLSQPGFFVFWFGYQNGETTADQWYLGLIVNVDRYKYLYFSGVQIISNENWALKRNSFFGYIFLILVG